MGQRRRNNGNNKLPIKAKLLIAAVIAIVLFQIILLILIQTGNFDKVEALYGFLKHTSDLVLKSEK